MRQEDYARRNVLFYPGMNLSSRERERMDRYEVKTDELTTDHIVYSMAKQIENTFQNFFQVAESVVGDEKALEIAREIGRRHGGTGYSRLLEANKTPGHGSPRMMALYQDLVHAIRGPKHTSALFAEFDDERCVVRRDQCVFYDERRPENGKYTGAFEAGVFEGFKRADPGLDRVDVHACRWRGDARCEIHWIWKARQRTEGPKATGT